MPGHNRHQGKPGDAGDNPFGFEHGFCELVTIYGYQITARQSRLKP